MKKLFLVFAVAGSLVACDNAADATKDLKDSSDSVESLKKESVTEAADQAIQNIEKEHDSLEKKIDSVGKKVDSTYKAQ